MVGIEQRAKERLPRERCPYFAVVGGVGVGKSELTDLLGKTFGMAVFREDFAPNPYLPLFYGDDPAKHAFDSQMFFLTEEAKQMRPLSSKLQTDPIIHDQSLEGDRFFATILYRKMKFISKEDHATYETCYRALMRGNFLPKPDIFIAVTASEQTVVARIKERKREMELAMHARYPNYFPTIARSFNTWFKLLRRRHPVIIINTDDFDFVNNNRARDHILGEVRDWSGYYISNPNQMNFRSRDGLRLCLPKGLGQSPGHVYDITPGLPPEQKVLQRG